MSQNLRELIQLKSEINQEVHGTLTTFEALQIACMITQNRILEEALMTGKEYPGSLEAISVSLGFNHGRNSDLVTNLKSISGDIESFVADNK